MEASFLKSFKTGLDNEPKKYCREQIVIRCVIRQPVGGVGRKLNKDICWRSSVVLYAVGNCGKCGSVELLPG